MNEINSTEDLKNLLLVNVDESNYPNWLIFTFDDGNKIKMYHEQDCCENVEIVDIDGDLQDLVGGVLVDFSERKSNLFDELQIEIKGIKPSDDSYTWTFYHITTSKGSVNIRWLGESNGYYSEGVSVAVFDSKLTYGKWRTIKCMN
ncbi:MAG: hypothetical protein ACKO8L_12255 [Flavobacterium sp.]